MKIGFTGTQIGMSPYQKKILCEMLHAKRAEWGVHGDCIGSDAEFHEICKAVGMKIEIHPPSNSYKRAFCKGDLIKESFPYLERNHNIVDACDIMFATPKSEEEELRSGTWATIRYARKKNKQCIILKREISK